MSLRTALLALGFILCAATALPHLASASTIPYWGPIIPDGWNMCPGSFAGLIIVANNIISFLLTFILSFFLPLALVYGGWLYMTSGGNPGQRREANHMILNIVIGVTIALASWLIVDTMLSVFYSQSAVGTPWYSLFSGSGDPCLLQNSALYQLNQSGGATNGVGSGGLSVVGSGGGTITAIGADGTTFRFQNGSESQLPAASQQLKDLVGCIMASPTIQNTSFGGIYAITSHDTGTNTALITACANGTATGITCGHAVNSCHFGGRQCAGQSHAVDFGTAKPGTAESAALSAAARACGAGFVNQESTHLHVSTPGCGCDGD